VDQLGIRPFRPTPWKLVELVRESADGNGDGDAHRREERKLVLPIETSSGDPGIGEPGDREVVEHIVPREAFALPVEDARDELVAQQVVVEEPGGRAVVMLAP